MTNFKKGDAVVVLDDDLGGIVKNIVDQTITIETEEGFELTFSAKELIHQKTSNDLHSSVFENMSLSDVVDEKETKKRKPTRSKKTKERYEPTLEVDLHIHHLTNSTQGMTNHDMLTLQLDTARRQLDFAIRKRIQKVVFIHGVGEVF